MKAKKESGSLRRKEFAFESLQGEEGTYTKSKGVKEETIGFWLRFISEHFIPCKHCQERLAKIIANAEELHLGNDNKPPIELWRKYEIDEDAWQEIERRPSTEEEKNDFKRRHLWFA